MTSSYNRKRDTISPKNHSTKQRAIWRKCFARKLACDFHRAVHRSCVTSSLCSITDTWI